jgi:hypothetical protein
MFRYIVKLCIYKSQNDLLFEIEYLRMPEERFDRYNCIRDCSVLTDATWLLVVQSCFFSSFFPSAVGYIALTH